MYKSFSMELAGRTLTVDVGRVAAQANGAAFMHTATRWFFPRLPRPQSPERGSISSP